MDGCRDLLLDDCAPLACGECPVRFVGGSLLTPDTGPEIGGYSGPLLSTAEPEPTFVDAHFSLLVLFFLKEAEAFPACLKLGKESSTAHCCNMLGISFHPSLIQFKKEKRTRTSWDPCFNLLSFFLNLLAFAACMHGSVRHRWTEPSLYIVRILLIDLMLIV